MLIAAGIVIFIINNKKSTGAATPKENEEAEDNAEETAEKTEEATESEEAPAENEETKND